MDVLLREVTTRPDGIEEYHDTEVNVDEVTLGAAPDRVIQLLGEGIAREHAVVKGSGGRARVVCAGRSRIDVGGKTVRSANLAEGDRFEIGGHTLELIAAPAGFDLAIGIHRNLDVQSSAFEEAFSTSLTETWLSKRGPAWALLVLVLLLTLVVPLLLSAPDAPSAAGRGDAAVLREAATHPLVPTDRLWSTGPILPAHQLVIGDDCSACHMHLFQRVQDDACTTCHELTLDHVASARAALFDAPPERCATCHLEHNEPPSLVVRADRLCTDCHASPEQFSPHAELDAVTGFTRETHPAFDVYLLKAVTSDGGTGLVFDWRVNVEPLADATEESHLKFPHDVHLDASKVQKPGDGTAMSCADCHALSADQEHFQPITMEAHCRDCHDLQFDQTDPGRELPHGDPLEVVLTIEGHFMRKYADPNASRGGTTRRRLPDRERESDVCTDGVFECGRRRTEREAMNQFTRRGCVTCHDVNDNGGTDLYSRFQVYPVQLASDYFPTALFNHASHLTQEGVTGDGACITCHAADVAPSSEVVLVPDIDNCVECHGDATVPERVTLQCIDCHAYHPGQHPAL